MAGGYRWNPPTLLVTDSMSHRRQQFTLLHELGHHIQKTDIALGTRIVEHREPEAFEDACCDAFAAGLLLPDDLVSPHLADRGPTVRTATELFDTSNASRAAICVRLAALLPSAGVAVVLDDAGIVTFAAARGGLYPPARGSDQTRNPLVAAALQTQRDGRIVTRDDGQIWYRTGHSSDRLYGQAAWAGDRLFVLMVAYSAPWLSFSPPLPGTAEDSTARVEECEHCEQSFAVESVCPTCSEPRCPAGHCECTTKTYKACRRCFLQRHRSQFAPASDICRECTS
ncbi:ImmA/IrrE family metallo-endopeptidase [Mycolicibacterium neoaurum]|uniref:ImmA/IrrE family metallo-endopeptidase n=1 Tax=Mycolicibacterium neoaurum TaxID=1795 RepID=UPI0026711317|nr:ImmA/IrrE family metallo-endopeptidase [Mycolicibacterium neoaurum]MDO3399180.1 ImmA/IrrE family metallo-endopeptidase [Mycolicibacterium neoaurum]